VQSAAGSLIAVLVGAKQAEMVEQRGTWTDLRADQLTIDKKLLVSGFVAFFIAHCEILVVAAMSKLSSPKTINIPARSPNFLAVRRYLAKFLKPRALL
jgi:hypothetical protein